MDTNPFEIFTTEDLIEMRETSLASADDVTRPHFERLKAEGRAMAIFNELVERGEFRSRDSI